MIRLDKEYSVLRCCFRRSET